MPDTFYIMKTLAEAIEAKARKRLGDERRKEGTDAAHWDNGRPMSDHRMWNDAEDYEREDRIKAVIADMLKETP